MLRVYLHISGFTYCVCGRINKSKGRIQKLKGRWKLRHIYKNEIYQVCFQNDLAYGDFKDLPRRTASNKVLQDEEFNVAENPKYDAYQREIA